MSSTRTRILDDIKSAMKAGNKPQLAILRQLSAAIKQVEIDSRTELDEEDVIAVLDKQQKQRRESISQYEQAGREDLVATEREELALIQNYLPAQLDEAEMARLIDAAVESTGASGVRDMGKVMAELKPQVQGRVDMSALSGLVKSRLGS